MLKRAGISLIIALVAAVLGFGGLLDHTAVVAQAFAYVFSGFCLLSLLFSLFEEKPEPKGSPLLVQGGRLQVERPGIGR